MVSPSIFPRDSTKSAKTVRSLLGLDFEVGELEPAYNRCAIRGRRRGKFPTQLPQGRFVERGKVPIRFSPERVTQSTNPGGRVWALALRTEILKTHEFRRRGQFFAKLFLGEFVKQHEIRRQFFPG